jgi:hypothetical protein
MTPTLGQRILGTLALVLGVIVTLVAIVLALVIVPVVLIVTTVVLIVARFFGLGDFTMIRRTRQNPRQGDGHDVLTLCQACGRVCDHPSATTCPHCGKPLNNPSSPASQDPSQDQPVRRPLPANSSPT